MEGSWNRLAVGSWTDTSHVQLLGRFEPLYHRFSLSNRLMRIFRSGIQTLMLPILDTGHHVPPDHLSLRRLWIKTSRTKPSRSASDTGCKLASEMLDPHPDRLAQSRGHRVRLAPRRDQASPGTATTSAISLVFRAFSSFCWLAFSIISLNTAAVVGEWKECGDQAARSCPLSSLPSKTAARTVATRCAPCGDQRIRRFLPLRALATSSTSPSAREVKTGLPLRCR